MELDEGKLSIFRNKLQEYQPQLRCPICNNTEWGINEKIFELREFNGGNMVIGGTQTIYPVIAIGCSVCGYTHFINAITIGVIEPQKKDDKNG